MSADEGPFTAALAALTPRLMALDDLAGARVLVGCSGGADSLALVAIARAMGLDVVAVHVDHGLHEHSATAAGRACAAARALGAAAEVCRVQLEPGANLEARARDARYAALEQARVAHGAVATLVAHTADDQAETVLGNLLRGAGSAGLAGMAPIRGSLRRPLLGVRRAETAALCTAAGLEPLHDPMNDDPAFRRVRLRHEVLPLLDEVAGRDVVPLLLRTAELARAESGLLDELAAAALQDVGSPPRAAALGALPEPLLRRALRLLAGHPWPSAARIDDAVAVVRTQRVAAQLGAGRRIERRRGRILVRAETAPATQPGSPAQR